MVQCVKCQNLIPDGQDFCPSCGEFRPAAPPKPEPAQYIKSTCPQCGSPVFEWGKNCPGCGTFITILGQVADRITAVQVAPAAPWARKTYAVCACIWMIFGLLLMGFSFYPRGIPDPSALVNGLIHVGLGILTLKETWWLQKHLREVCWFMIIINAILIYVGSSFFNSKGLEYVSLGIFGVLLASGIFMLRAINEMGLE